MHHLSIRAIALAGLAGAVMLAAPLAAQVPSDPAEAVEYRQSQMSTFGDNIRVIVGYVRQGNGTMDDVRSAAANMVEIAPHITDWFPEGTGVGVADSEALAVIWEEWDTFEQTADDATAAIADVAAVALRGDEEALPAAVGAMGQSCGACHEDFRVEN
jgi:cytochrome c556